MKVVSTESGTIFDVFLPDDVRGARDVYLPDVLNSVGERYQFVERADPKTAAENGAKFKLGKLSSADALIAIDEMNIFRDGLAVTCRTTEQAQIVVSDLMEWGVKNGYMINPAHKLSTRFLSALVVDFDEPLSKAIRGFSDIQGAFSAALKRQYNKQIDIDLIKLAFAADPMGIPQGFGSTELTIERRKNTPFEINRHFSVAPLSTSDHVSLLTLMEQRFTAA